MFEFFLCNKLGVYTMIVNFESTWRVNPKLGLIQLKTLKTNLVNLVKNSS